MATNLDIQKMYIAYFGRPADVSGLTYWTNQITQANGDASAVINAFSASAEYADNYAGKSNEFIVNSLYNNLFGRDAEVDGLTYWSGKLLDGTFNVGNVAWAIMSGAQNEDVTALGNKATAAQTFTDSMDTTTEILGYSGSSAAAAAKAWLVTVTDTQASLDDAVASVDTAVANTVAAGSASQGQTFTLTTGIDTFTPTTTVEADRTTDGNDTFNALIDGTTGAVATTLTALDTIDGGAGKDTINLNILNGNGVAGTAVTALPSTSVTNVEVLNIRSAVDVTADTTTWTGLTTANVTQGTAATVTAAATTDVNVSGATGAIEVKNAKDVTITDATAAQTITIGDAAATTGNPAGKVTITDTDNSGANAIIVTGGTDVTVTATSKAATGDITVGNATNGTATGNVVVTQNLLNDGAAALDNSAKAITVTGGKTVTITQNANSIAELATSDADITVGKVAVTADDKTTDVTVKAIDNITKVTQEAVAEVKGTAAVTFKAVAAGDIVTVNSLVFTAAKDLTAAEVAQAFANLTATDTQSTGGITTNGIYTAALAANFTSGAANGATVVFTNTAAAAAPTMTITATDSASNAKASALPSSTPTTGTAAVVYDISLNDVVNNTVTIDDNATKTIENITVDGATTVTLGTTGSLDALKTLSLANVSGATGITSTVETLDMTVDNVTGAITLGASLESLNLKSENEASASAMASTTLKNLTIDAAAALNVSGGTMMSTAAGLENITVKGTSAVTLGTVASTALKSFDASANTGGVTATINAQTGGSSADLKTFTFSEGNDVVTTGNAVVNKDINLGAGDDKITLATSSTAINAAIKGGTGTDTIAMEAATAATLLVGAAANFTEKVTGFERLELTNATADDTALTIDLAAIGGYNYVTTAGTGDSTTSTTAITLDNMANNGTVVLTAANGAVTTGSTGIVVNVKDADTVDSTLNTVISSTGDLDAGLLTAADVKTVNINLVDTEAATPQTINSDDLILTANAATTVKVTGTANLDLDLTGSTKVTLVDASQLNGGLTATTAISTAATTIKGGSGVDVLTATSNNDVLMGGAGNDTLIVTSGNLVQLHGGAGKDTYQFGASSNQSAFATINGTAAELSGDIIEFGTGPQNITFSTAKLVLDADVASFDSYVNLASNQVAGQVSYFQWSGNTYLVQDVDGTATGTFVAGADTIVKITGLVDFTFNDNIGASATVLEIA